MPLVFVNDKDNILNGIGCATSQSYVEEYVSDLSTLNYDVRYSNISGNKYLLENLRYEIPVGTYMIYVSAAFIN